MFCSVDIRLEQKAALCPHHYWCGGGGEGGGGGQYSITLVCTSHMYHICTSRPVHTKNGFLVISFECIDV